jgi:indolepyruvate ferredoxin oxidoreductase, beta subunit
LQRLFADLLIDQAQEAGEKVVAHWSSATGKLRGKRRRRKGRKQEPLSVLRQRGVKYLHKECIQMTSVGNKGFTAMRIFFTGVGGQGTLLATRLVGEVALLEGLPVTMSEIHGMAQRGGVVESSVAIGNIYSPTIADGEADVVMAFEPLETLRALPKCHAGTLVISNTVPIIPFTVATGRSVYPSMEAIYGPFVGKVARLLRVPALELAREAGSSLAANMVMLGVLAGTRKLPLADSSWQTVLRERLPERFLAVNQRAFTLGYALASKA